MSTREPEPIRITAEVRARREIRRAERLAERGQVSEAIRSLEAAIRHGADGYTCYLRQARLYQGRKQWREALTAAEKAVELHPNRLTAREAVIALHLEAGDYAGAVLASKALLRISPRHMPARDALGAAYFGMGDIDSAIIVTDELIRLDPCDAGHRVKKALLCQHRGDVCSAMEQLLRAVDIGAGGDLCDSAQQQIEALDTYQLTHILTLAMEDAFFRAKLRENPAEACTERGFYLSPFGIELLCEALVDIHMEIEPGCRVNLYH